MDILFQGSVAKYFDCPEDNEDAFHVNDERGRIVICDGASESYDGKNWARLLVEKFAEAPPSEEALGECLNAFSTLHDPTTMTWSKASAYERGSFATILIAQDDLDRRVVTVQCVGDSFAFLTDGKDLLSSFPYQVSAEFEGKPTLISTLARHNTHLFTDSGQFSFAQTQWSYAERSPLFLLCMTDALGAWLLRSIENGDNFALEQLIDIRMEQDLRELVELERMEGRMRRDDSTLVIALL
ncbi:MAG TPA: hypothetical protein VME63_03085 [Dyella sp.]|uniref:hypothetical protein n=1 Tax=Dyella sp. TaxID=1869338 RepID=UPI002BDFC208|nr:hypothetical protein [Dyella sp.]HTV84360.1 hypothetical protein [Dyella sp.]